MLLFAAMQISGWTGTLLSTPLCLGIPRSCNRLLNIEDLEFEAVSKERALEFEAKVWERNNSCCTECLFHHCKEKETNTFAKGEKTKPFVIMRFKSPKVQYGMEQLHCGHVKAQRGEQ